MTEVVHWSDIELTRDASYLNAAHETWGNLYEYVESIWTCCNGTMLYLFAQHHFCVPVYYLASALVWEALNY